MTHTSSSREVPLSAERAEHREAVQGNIGNIAEEFIALSDELLGNDLSGAGPDETEGIEPHNV